MSVEGNFLYKSASTGKFETGVIGLRDYELAERHGMRVSQLINSKYPDADPQLGDAWSQGVRSAGIFAKGDPKYGILPTTIKDAMSGDCSGMASAVQMAGNTIAAPSTPIGSSTPTSRLFLPEVILQRIDQALMEDYNPEVAMWNSMISITENISGPIFTIPMIDTTAPRDIDSRPIGQNALPRNMISISASQVSHSLHVESLGLQIADQAMQLATIDLVGIIVAQQVEGSRFRQLFVDLGRVVTGNVEMGETALPVTGFKATYDSAAGVNEITHKGWIKFLYDPTRKLRLDTIICTLDGYLAIQDRTGRPLYFDPKTTGINTGNAGSYGIDTTISAPANLAALGVQKVMLVPDGVFPAHQILAFDSRFALRRVINSSAAYSAVEHVVLTRSNFYRWDHSEVTHRLRPESFIVLDYSNP